MSWIPYILNQFLKCPLEKLDRHRISFTILPQEKIVVVRPTNVQFNHQFIFNYMYSRESEYPENYLFQYRISRTDKHILQFLIFVHHRILNALNHPDHRLWQNTKEDYVSLLPKQDNVRNLQQWSTLLRLKTHTSIPDYEKYITFFLSHIHSYVPFQLSVRLTGCTRMEIFRCLSTKNQILYLLGEHHEMNGNFMECLQTIIQNTKCPIDIILETTYEWSKAESPNGPFFLNQYPSHQKSNGRFLSQTFKQCLVKGNVPKPTQIVHESTYFKQCIAPFKGRVKLWSEDYRFHDRFIFLSFLDIDLPDETYQKEKHRLIHSFYDHFCDFHSFHHQFEIYYKQLETILEEIETFVRHYFPSIRFEIPFRPKGLKKLVQSFQHFHPDVIQYWFQVISEHSFMQKEYFSCLLDLPVVLRTLQLCHTQKDRLIFILCGTFHVYSIVDLLTKPIQYLHSDEVSYRFNRIDIPLNDQRKEKILPYPPFHSKDTTPQIQSYQRHPLSFSKSPNKKK